MAAVDGKILLKNNSCYKAACKIVPKGIVVHSTGADNPTLRRYIAPDDGVIGKNQYGNDWNRPGLDVCVHAFIGKDKDGKVKTYQTLPFNYACWGCGGGSKGSYNYNPPYIQFEMCEDGRRDYAYCKAVYDKAVSLCAYLCKKYKLNPDNIVGHHEAHVLGYASDHSDPECWWNSFGFTMSGFRKAVRAKLAGKVKTKRACYLYAAPYKDPAGDSVASIRAAKGTALEWLSDDGYGWSKVKYKGKTYYAINSNLKKSGLSKCERVTVGTAYSLRELKGKALVKPGKLKLPAKFIRVCTIEQGKYKGYSLLKRRGKYYYGKI